MNNKFSVLLFFLIIFFSMSLISADGNFTLLQKEINDAYNVPNELTLYDNYSYSVNDPTTGVTITEDDFLLNGNGNTINGDGQARIFNITANNVTIKNLNIINAFSSNGGAIYTTGNISIDNCNFTNNKVTDNGGVIYNSGATVNIINGNYENNIASTGGIIYNTGNVNITGGYFNNNFASFGGVIYNYFSTLYIFGTIFKNNTANGANWGGGVIVNWGGTINIINSEFYNNIAINEGGAINNYGGSNASIINVTFINNTAEHGGAIENVGNINISSSIFTNNRAEGIVGFGGAIENYNGNLIIISSEFYNNTAQTSGAVIYNTRPDSTLNVSYSIFYNNAVVGNNKTIYIAGSSGVVDLSSNFWGNNTLNFTQLIFNGTNYILNDYITVELVLDSPDNVLNLNDDLIYHINISLNDTSKSLDISNLPNVFVNLRNTTDVIDSFSAQDKSAPSSGNTLITSYTPFNLDLYYYDNLLNNVSYTLGPGYNFRWLNATIYNSNGFVDLKGKTIKYDPNTDENFTNGISITNKITIINGTVNGNKQARIFYVTNTANLTLKDITLVNGTAIDGGAIYSNGGNVTINNSNFTENNATNGSVVYNRLIGNIIIDGGKFTNNNATHGGVIFNTDYGIVNILGGEFTNNKAIAFDIFYGYGGVIYNTDGGIVIIDGGQFTNNKADMGIVIYNNGNLNLINNIFNSSSLNHLVYNQNDGILFLNNNTMINMVNDEKIYNNGTIISRIVLRIMNNDTVYGNNVVLNATLKDDNNNFIVGQNITLTNPNLDNINLSYFDNGMYNISYNVPSLGTYLINGFYTGGDNLTIQMGLLKNKAITSINVTVDNVTYGEAINVDYNLTTGADGSITIIIKDNDNITAFSTTTGVGVAVHTYLDAGEYTIFLTYNGNDMYNISSNFTTFTVYKAGTSVDVDVGNITFGDNLTVDYLVNSIVPGNITGNVTVIVRNSSGIVYNTTFLDTDNIIEIPYINGGDYLLNLTYNGDGNYSKSSIAQSFSVYKAGTSVIVGVSNVTFADNLTVDYRVSSNVGGVISGNVTVIVKNSSGIVYNTTFLDTGNIIEIPYLSAGNYLLNLTYNGDGNYNKSSIVQSFTVYKASTNIVLDVSNITFGDNLTVIYSVIGAITGNVTIIIKDLYNNPIYNQTFLNLSNIIIIPNLNAGEYNISVIYNGDDNYLNSSFIGVFEVFKLFSNLIFNVTNVVYGEYPFITINLTTPNLINTTVSGEIQDMSLNLSVPLEFNLTDGYYEGSLSNWGSLFPAAMYWIMLEYSDDNYEYAYNDTIFEVFKDDIIANITEENMVYDGNQTIKISVKPDLGGNITLMYNNQEIEAPINNTEAIFSNLGLNPGSHNITIFYPGNRNYNDYNQTIVVNISKRNDNNLAIKDSEIVYSDNETIVITINPELTGNLTVVIENQTIANIPIINGTITIPNLKLQAGNHSLDVIYTGDDNFNRFNSTLNFIVIKANITLTVVNTNISASDNQTLLINVNPDVIGNMTLVINGTEYIAPINNGTVIFLINDLNSGNYTGTIVYDGDNNYNDLNTTLNFNIFKTDLILNASDIFIFYRDGTRYIAILTDTHGNPIVNQTIYITVHGVTYERVTNVNGTVYLNINLLPMEYNITAYYNGSAKYINASITTILIINSTIISSDFVKYYRNGTQYEITLLGGDGNPLANKSVEFNINGVKYYRNTDNNGIATLAINLNPGNYTITTSYEGLNISNNIQVLATLIGKDLVKNFGDSEQYEVNVLDGVGNPLPGQNVEVNIHGVFYNLLSDSSGIARLNINLNPGSYIATSFWNGYATSNSIRVI